MELYQLKSFITVADTGNLTQAADRLFTSQPAVSAHIKALEEELEIKLFERTSKGMSLTDNGITLREKATVILNASNDLVLKAKTLQGILTGQAKIGLNTDAEYLLLAKWHSTLMQRYPQLKTQLTQGTSQELLKNISTGSLDVTFFSGENTYDEVQAIQVCKTNSVIAAAPKWSEQLNNADTEGLGKLPWIYPDQLCIYHTFIDEVFPDPKKQPNWVASSATEDSTLTLIKTGTGLAFIRDDEADVMLKKGDIVVWPGKSFSLPLSIAYLKSREEDPIVKALVDVIREKFIKRCGANPAHS